MEREYLPRQDRLIPRPRIDELLRTGLEGPLVTLVAGPGYGKTVAVREFCRSAKEKLVWLHLLALDNDIPLFWRRLNEAVAREVPAWGQALKELEFPDTAPALSHFLREINEMCAGMQILLVLDNAESITNQILRNFLDTLIHAGVQGLHTIFISNARPDFSSHIGMGRNFHIGPGELRYDPEEAARFFELHDIPIGPEELRQTLDVTGGWPLALRLAVSQPEKAAGPVFGENATMHVITALFEQNYYLNYERTFRRDLVKLSLLPLVTLELMRVVCCLDPEEITGCLAHNTFMAYEYSRGEFLFQRMYRDFLAQKKGMLTEEEVAALLTAAGEWYQKKVYYQYALECYWEARDYTRFMRALLMGPRKKAHGQFAQWVLDKLMQFPPDCGIDPDTLDFCRGYLLLCCYQPDKAEEVLGAVIRRLEDREDLTEDKRLLLGDAYIVMTDVSLARNNLDGVYYILKALPLLPNGTRLAAEDLMLVGNNEIFFLPDNKPGGVDGMITYIIKFDEYVRRLHWNGKQGYAFLFAAEGCFLAGRMQDAWEYSVKASYAGGKAGMYDIGANSFILQMRITLMQGNCEEAKILLDRLGKYVATHAPGDLARLVDSAAGLYYLRMHDLERVPAWLKEDTTRTGSPLPDVGRDCTIRASYHFMRGDWSRAYAILLELDDVSAQRSLWSLQVTALLLKAACLLRMGNARRAVQLLWQAYDMTWQNWLTSFFAELGQLTLGLLSAAEQQNDYHFDQKWMEKVRAAAMGYAKHEATMLKRYANKEESIRSQLESLTRREKQVLEYLAQGYTRDDLTRILGISVHGVKKHIANTYKKLGAVNRIDAIHIAIANGIIESYLYADQPEDEL